MEPWNRFVQDSPYKQRGVSCRGVNHVGNALTQYYSQTPYVITDDDGEMHTHVVVALCKNCYLETFQDMYGISFAESEPDTEMSELYRCSNSKCNLLFEVIEIRSILCVGDKVYCSLRCKNQDS